LYLKNDLLTVKDDYLLHWTLHILGSMTLMAFVMMLWMNQSYKLVDKARISEIYFNVKSFEQQVTMEYLKTGRWPKAFIRQGQEVGLSSVDRMTFDGAGRFDFYFTRDDLNLDHNKSTTNPSSQRILSFVASRDMSSPFSSTIWLCGYATPPDSFSLLAKNLTTISDKHLPFACRSSAF